MRFSDFLDEAPDAATVPHPGTATQQQRGRAEEPLSAPTGEAPVATQTSYVLAPPAADAAAPLSTAPSPAAATPDASPFAELFGPPATADPVAAATQPASAPLAPAPVALAPPPPPVVRPVVLQPGAPLAPPPEIPNPPAPVANAAIEAAVEAIIVPRDIVDRAAPTALSFAGLGASANHEHAAAPPDEPGPDETDVTYQLDDLLPARSTGRRTQARSWSRGRSNR